MAPPRSDESREPRVSDRAALHEADRGAQLELSSALDTEQLVCARGSLFLVTERHGDIVPKGARELGLFDRDTRHLSHLRLRIVDLELVHLSAETTHDAYNQVDLMVAGFEPGDLLDDPQHFLHVSRRQLLDGGLVEELTITNFLHRTAELEVALEFDCDFADIFEVRGAKRARRGVRQPATLTSESVTHAYLGLDGVRYATEISLKPAPQLLTETGARFALQLEPGGTQRIEFTVLPLRAATNTTHAATPFVQRIERQREEARRFRDESTRIRCDNAIVQRVFEQSVVDLHSLRLAVGSNRIVAAGIPWFCCPFGRDSLLASYEALLLNPALATESLRVLAAYQGRRDCEVTAEEPGKIFHELRFGEMATSGEMPHSPYYGSVNATPLFVIVMEAAHRFTADLEFRREMRASLIAALQWIDGRSDCATRFVTYQKTSAQGLDNQGWKDSRAGVPFPDGRRAQPPIALCEVQGYCIDAYAQGARLLALLGDDQLAVTYSARALALRTLTDEQFWLPHEGRYAFAIDGLGRKIDTIVSNLGHLLWSRVPNPERALATAELLLSPPSFSGFGVRTLAANQAAYNPLSYHNGTVWPHDNAIIAQGMANYGWTRYATTIFEALIGAMNYFPDRRLPELFCGMPHHSGNLVRYPVACSPQAWASAAPFLLLKAVLGLDLDAPDGVLSIRNASLPPSIEWIELEGLRVGTSRVSLRLRRLGKHVHVERFDLSGPTLRTQIEIE